LHSIEEFDAGFFEIAPREAQAMDPQQRLLLETSWEALEQAGILPKELKGTLTGVFIGQMYFEYGASSQLEELDGYIGTGSAGSVSSGRLSYFLGLQGPAITIDTACSSSLVSLHLACQALRSNECNLALAGGVTVMVSPNIFIEFSRLRGLAKDGRCKSFSAQADGAGWAEGCGIVVLKRLSDAQRDGDKILALIRSTAVNQDGRSQGLTAPNGPSQQRVISRALELSGLLPEEIDAIEAHGTGTSLGDPIEAGALASVFGASRSKERPLYLGSSKSNIGHSQAAAGIAGVMKVVLALQNERLPKTLYAEQPSPHINWEGSGLELLTESKPWPRNERIRRAGVSSFGISGTNAHVILEEAPQEKIEEEKQKQPIGKILLLSGQTQEALKGQASQYAEYIERHPELELVDICHSAATHRTHFSHRLTININNAKEEKEAVIKQLREYVSNEYGYGVEVGSVLGERAKVGFLFTGQGSQYVGMGRELYEKESIFREVVDKCDSIIAPLLGKSILKVMLAEEGSEEAELINQTQYTQPALFVLEYGLYELWKSFGIKAEGLIGHSIGELVAATVAGIFTLEDGLRLAVERARLMGAMPRGGAMVSLELNKERVLQFLEKYEGKISIAGINEPNQTVISGENQSIEELLSEIELESIKYKKLKVSHAFHSHMMEEAVGEFEEIVSSVMRNEPEIQIASNLTGKIEREALVEARYWGRQIREAVDFVGGIKALVEQGINTFIELGPEAILCGLGSQCIKNKKVSWYPSLKKKQTDSKTLLESIGRVWINGIELDLEKVLPGKFVNLPTYSFQRKKYWLEKRKGKNRGDVTSAGLETIKHPLLGAVTSLGGEEGYLLTGRLSLKEQPWLGEHKVFDTVIVAGAAILELTWAAGEVVGAERVEELMLIKPIVLSTSISLQLQIRVGVKDSNGKYEINIYSRPENEIEGEWVKNATGSLNSERVEQSIKELKEWPPEGSEYVELNGFYSEVKELGLDYGRVFQGLKEVWRKDRDLYVRVELGKEQVEEAKDYGLHPVLLDSVLHVLFVDGKEREKQEVKLPFEWRGAKLYASGAKEIYACLEMKGEQNAKLSLYDSARLGLGEIEGLRLQQANANQIQGLVNTEHLYQVSWRSVNKVKEESKLTNSIIIGEGELSNKLKIKNVPSINEIKYYLEKEIPRKIIIDNTKLFNIEINDETKLVTQEALKQLQELLLEEKLRNSELIWVTQEAIATETDENILGLSQSGIWGLIRSARNEHISRQIRLIDIDIWTDKEQLVKAINVEEEPEIAIRKGKMIVPRLVKSNVSNEESNNWKNQLDKATVVITGGTGELGSLVAKHLVTKHGAKNLLLVSRRGLEAPGAIELEKELEQQGTEIEIVSCDISNYVALEEVIKSLSGDKPIVGVIHCSGVLDDGVVLEQNEERLAKVMSSKIDGAWNLHLLTKEKNLDFFVVFSSIAGVIGTLGQSNYAAANTFLDALAAYRQQQGLPGQSLAWGLWNQMGVGVTSQLTNADLARMKRQGIVGLSPSEGLELLDKAISKSVSLLVPASLSLTNRQDIPALLRELVKQKSKKEVSSKEATKETSELKKRLARLSEKERFSSVVSIVQTEIAMVMSLSNTDGIPAEKQLKELGLDSLMAIELRNRLSMRCDIELPTTLAFDYPTPSDIAKLLLEKAFGDLIVAKETTLLPINQRENETEPIAIVSMACRLPGGIKNAEEYWSLLDEGGDAIELFPEERWDADALYDVNPEAIGKTYCKEGGFLHSIEEFDAGFFEIAPREAQAMDPQQRLLLETSWEALEQAGILPKE
ncbi:MAG: SDR family NAD(P)-dependent oxidoreductase, partial [Blastocatellia bacterium]|nr:SDR family NAD(P)-dependent oxidoreductase [Blastocatellia bacterium]